MIRLRVSITLRSRAPLQLSTSRVVGAVYDYQDLLSKAPSEGLRGCGVADVRTTARVQGVFAAAPLRGAADVREAKSGRHVKSRRRKAYASRAWRSRVLLYGIRVPSWRV